MLVLSRKPGERIKAPFMRDNPCTAPDRDIRVEDFAAELTGAVYPHVLGRGPKDRWIDVELALWRALTGTVEEWARRRPPDASSLAFEVWREKLVLNSTRSASSIAQESGIEGSLLALEWDLYRAVRPVARRRSRVSESE
jgi:hypothetical protein